MGLDDFKGEPTDEHKRLKEELSQNSPPGNSNKWSEHEPGVPEWTDDTCGEKVDSDDMEYFRSGIILHIGLDKPEGTCSKKAIASDKYVSLDDAI